MLTIRTILHPTDLSDHCDCAFRLSCSLARDYGARLIVLHVSTPPVVGYGGGVIPPEPAELKNQLRERLHQVQARDPKVQLDHRLVEGDPATEILRIAEGAGCDLIVMGTHGRRGLGRLLIGSVAEQVVRKAACPVLTVKTPQGPESSYSELVTAEACEQTEAMT
jgi:nucleotide-binding universal stress UspA family protein